MTTFAKFIPKNEISLKKPWIPEIPRFSPKDVEIPNLGTNSPKVGTLDESLTRQSDNKRSVKWVSVSSAIQFLFSLQI